VPFIPLVPLVVPCLWAMYSMRLMPVTMPHFLPVLETTIMTSSIMILVGQLNTSVPVLHLYMAMCTCIMPVKLSDPIPWNSQCMYAFVPVCTCNWFYIPVLTTANWSLFSTQESLPRLSLLSNWRRRGETGVDDENLETKQGKFTIVNDEWELHNCIPTTKFVHSNGKMSGMKPIV